MGTTLRTAPSKSYAFSTNYHACIAMPTWRRCALAILFWPWPPNNLFPKSCLTWIFFAILTDGHHFACNAQQKLCIFNKIKLSCIHCNVNISHVENFFKLLFSFWGVLGKRMLNPEVTRLCLTFFVDPYLWVPFCMQRSAKAMPFQQIIMHAMPTWRRCAPPILFWPWPYYLLPWLCLTWIFLHW